jgi:hypothetical protein
MAKIPEAGLVPQTFTLLDLADALHYTGSDRERSVRRLFDRHGISLLRLDRRTFRATGEQVAALMEAMKYSRSENAVQPGKSAIRRSVWTAKSVASKKDLKDLIAKRMDGAESRR